ncbi:MAG: hypothetical protein A3G96_06920 [Gammaproteobacteria bacterium RIFCSPLOWO2_12_FULL_52_10]|nr:MAG: hypothetical protein A3G96_06920 [Gammaproteobacteria bacterium RIFCSPLOWO2_12_FULL_52_10]
MEKELTNTINEAIMIARELNGLLHEDALHRLRIYKEYSYETDTYTWNPNLYQRCQLAEALCRKLASLES